MKLPPHKGLRTGLNHYQKSWHVAGRVASMKDAWWNKDVVHTEYVADVATCTIQDEQESEAAGVLGLGPIPATKAACRVRLMLLCSMPSSGSISTTVRCLAQERGLQTDFRFSDDAVKLLADVGEEFLERLVTDRICYE